MSLVSKFTGATAVIPSANLANMPTSTTDMAKVNNFMLKMKEWILKDQMLANSINVF